MNGVVTFTYGPILLIAYTLQQIFLIYAIYIIFFKPDCKKAIRERILGTLRKRLRRREIDFKIYRKLERDFKNIEL